MITRHRRRASRLVVVAMSCGLLVACSTSGRELRDTTMTVPPAAPANSSPPASLIEALGGFTLSSPEFVAGGNLPNDIGRNAGNRSPALQWTSTPEDAAELALAVTDATGANVYWLVTGLTTTDIIVASGTVPLDGTVQPNSTGRAAWDGPVADPGVTVPVVFRVYALDQPLAITPGLAPIDVVEQIAAGSFARATLTANYVGVEQPLMS